MILAIAALCELVGARRIAEAGAARSAGASGSASSSSGSTGSRPPSPSRRRCRPGSAGSRWCCCRSTSPSIRRRRRAGLAVRARQSRVALVLALAGAWVVTEWLRATMFTGFAWNPVGVTLVDTLDRLAAALDRHLRPVRVVVVCSAAPVWLLAAHGTAGRRSLWLPCSLAGSLPSVPPARRAARRPARPIRIVQPNIGQQDKWTPGFDEIAHERLEQLSIQRPTGGRA